MSDASSCPRLAAPLPRHVACLDELPRVRAWSPDPDAAKPVLCTTAGRRRVVSSARTVGVFPVRAKLRSAIRSPALRDAAKALRDALIREGVRRVLEGLWGGRC